MHFFDPPPDRSKFERNLFLLIEEMRNGRLRFAPGVTRMIDGVRRVRYLPNHRLDLLTVDETTRLMANMVVKTFDHGSMLGGGDEKGERDGFRAERAARTEDEGADDEVDDPT